MKSASSSDDGEELEDTKIDNNRVYLPILIILVYIIMYVCHQLVRMKANTHHYLPMMNSRVDCLEMRRFDKTVSWMAAIIYNRGCTVIIPIY